MNQFIHKVMTGLIIKPSHAFLLFLTGFFFAQVMIVNVLYTRHPNGGWATEMGMFTTPSILVTFLIALLLCLLALWRVISTK